MRTWLYDVLAAPFLGSWCSAHVRSFSIDTKSGNGLIRTLHGLVHALAIRFEVLCLPYHYLSDLIACSSCRFPHAFPLLLTQPIYLPFELQCVHLLFCFITCASVSTAVL
jgi:hypothetical protein